MSLPLYETINNSSYFKLLSILHNRINHCTRQINDEKTQWTQPELKLVKFHYKKVKNLSCYYFFFVPQIPEMCV